MLHSNYIQLNICRQTVQLTPERYRYRTPLLLSQPLSSIHHFAAVELYEWSLKQRNNKLPVCHIPAEDLSASRHLCSEEYIYSRGFPDWAQECSLALHTDKSQVVFI